jgi:K+-transporting ATPase A subunit
MSGSNVLGVVVSAVVPVLGCYMARVFRGEPTFLDPVVGPLERGTYRLLRVDPSHGQDWKAYARGVIFFSLWLLEKVPAEVLILRPDPEDERKVTAEGVSGHF